MIRRPPRSTRTDTLFPTRRSSDLFLSHLYLFVLDSLMLVPVYLLHHLIQMNLDQYHPLLYTQYRSEEHTSELQSLMRISYAVFCLKKKKKNQNHISHASKSR